MTIRIDINVEGMARLIEAIESLGGPSRHEQERMDAILKRAVTFTRKLGRVAGALRALDAANP